VERALDQIRHIEIQIAADSLGNVVRLFELRMFVGEFHRVRISSKMVLKIRH